MSRLAGSLSERNVLDVVHEVHTRRATGVLEIDSLGQRRRLQFIEGELHLPGAHPLAQRLASEVRSVRQIGATAGGPEAASARQGLLQLVERIARVVADWSAGEYRFEPQVAPPAGDLVGPLPTRRLLMMGATLEASEELLLQRLGGSSARLTAGTGAEGPGDLLGLALEERFLLERLRSPMSVRQLLSEAPEGTLETLIRLVQLSAVGLVVPVSAPRPEAAGASAARDDNRILVERLTERIRGSLEEKPIELGEREHRDLVGDLLARFGGIDYYELLGVRPDASEAKIQEAYERLARRVHPSHAARLGLGGGRDAALSLLFETVTVAYRTLSDPERRRQYNERQLIDVSPEIGASERQEEARALARSHFEKARAYSSAGDVHSAIQLLEQAARMDPRSEYLGALAEHLARNPNWRERAIETYRTALELDPNNAETRCAMGMLYEELGDPGRARACYSAALNCDPAHAESRQRLERLLDGPAGAGEGGEERRRGFFARLFGRS